MQREIKWNHTKYSSKTKEGIMRQKEKQGKSVTKIVTKIVDIHPNILITLNRNELNTSTKRKT